MTSAQTQQAFGFMGSRVAEERRRPNLVIEAGAGTGKTTAIVAEVLRLLLERDDVSPERIVLVTFTEKAAGEIADRIRHALSEIHEHIDEPRLVWPRDSDRPLLELIASPEETERREHYRRACERQLSRVDSLRSQTIHSFCQSLLRQFPIEAGLDPQFKIVQGFERSLLHQELYDAWLDSETRTGADPAALAEWEVLLTHAGYLFQIRQMIFALVERRDLLSEARESDFGDTGEILREVSEALEVLRTSDGDEATRRLCRYARSQPLPAPDASVDAWIEYLRPIANDIRTTKLPRSRKQHGRLIEALKILRGGDMGDSIYDRLVSHRAAVALLAVARRFIASLDAEKRARGAADFDDLLLRTAALLENPPVLQRVREQFDFIFVDEFQDTDRTQARIIDALARDATGQYVDGKLVIVGDPKQSIYGFRRADPETYYQMARRLAGAGAEERRLDDQYRSEPGLVSAINAIFTQLFPHRHAHDPNVFTPSYHPLRSGRRVGRERDASITFLRAQWGASGAAVQPNASYIAEAEAIAAWIESRRERSGSDLRQFALLFRRLNKVDDYLDTLRRHGIDCVLPPARMFLDRRAPVDLLAVLRAIGYSFDRGAEIAAARTPYFGLTDEEIAAGVLGEGETAPWNAFRAAMAKYRDAAQHVTVAGLIDLVIGETGIEQVYAMTADGDRSALHLEHLRRLAFEYDRRAGGSVRQFVDEITLRRTEPDEVEPSLIDEARNAVRILTVHAAKGLEFDTVILPDLGFGSGVRNGAEIFTTENPRAFVMTGGPQSLNAESLLDGEPLKKIAGRRDEAEMQRLFYVAVTRAKSEVVFVCNPDAYRRSGFYKCIDQAFGLTGDDLQTRWTDGRRIHQIAIGGNSVPVAFESLTTEDGARRRRRLTDEALERSLEDGSLLPVAIAEPPPFPLPSGAEIATRRAESRNRRGGILLHRVLERWDGVSPVAPLLDRLAAEIAADGATTGRVRQRLATIAKSPTFARIQRAETIGREISVRFVDEQGTLVEKRLDRVIREEGCEFVIDYKSGAPTATRLERDRAQVAVYRQALERITARPCRGLLWYIDLERDEVVEV